MTVTIKAQGNIAVITIDNPPVNALSAHVRAGLVKAVEQIDADNNIDGAVLTSAGRIFIGGADIKEFGKPSQQPFLPDVIAALENCRVPTVAAINGAALGGGLEVALGCRFRVAGPDAKCGLPEVHLGLIPGAGGTQRLPRLVGAVKAGEMVTSGKPLSADKALAAGVVDAVFADELLENATAFLQDKLAAGDMGVGLSTVTTLPNWDAGQFAKLEAKTKARARGQLSPVKALEAARAAQELSFTDGLKREREIFMECMNSPQRAGLIHAFFAQRQVAKVPGLDMTKTRPIKTVSILGAGTMGVGISLAFLAGGYSVGLFDINQEAQEAGLNRIVKTLQSNLSKGRITAKNMEAQIGRLSTVFDMQDLSNSDLIIEAATENLAVKKSIFRDLDRIAKPGAILATNTSYLDINILARETNRPSDVIGMHFFSPANIMKLLEVVRTDTVSDEVLATVMSLGKTIGKINVLSGVCDGFIGNRILKAYRKQADYMVEDGAEPQDIDRAMKAFGMAMGPFAVSDLAGIDIGYFNRRREDDARPKAERYSRIADLLYEQGRLGQKSGAGYYRYEDGSRTPIIDPVTTEIIAAERARLGITPRTFTDGEIRERILYAMINEGARILDEGIAARALDIDMVYIHGYGFPAYHGGPMFYADTIGTKAVYKKVEEFAKDDPYAWQAAPLLKNLAETGGTFKGS
ncbi:MAG: 3-hydroxyacyl-CoA dehydrogenase NAD-binding domain-containing protein [Robiginitomaculum sp.]|nr:3-hydroxyacyl-CoA dehydrogenase NAD-binding domain-containing protein [Robiginitomaculum sp.]